MSILGVYEALAGTYQHANRAQKAGISKASFMERSQEAAEERKMEMEIAYKR